ncbi:MAG: hypothetical protein WBY94_20175 [Polyangiaceae bacterium]
MSDFPPFTALARAPAIGLALALARATLLATDAAASDVASAPRGPVIEYGRPPAPPALGSSPAPACSVRRAVCVHAAPGTPPSLVIATLSAAEHAWDTLSGALALPPPDTDLDGAWHVYLVADIPEGGRAVLQECDPRARLDRCTAFALVDRATPPGCALDVALARAWARASLFRAAPATDEATARAQTNALARLAAPCEDPWPDALEFQSHPERTLTDPSSAAFDRGAALFYDWLDATFGRKSVGLLVGLWALAPTRTPPGAWRWSATPTGYDVLRASLKGALSTDSTIDDVFVKFAVERARATPSVRMAWHIPWPEQARRLASPEPVYPMGSSYVLVDAGPLRAKLRLEAQWEDYGRMRWVVLKLDAQGRTMAEVPVTSLPRATHASLTVESLENVDRLLVVGVNLGSTEHPFDPDQGEWEPHGWLVTLEGQ